MKTRIVEFMNCTCFLDCNDENLLKISQQKPKKLQPKIRLVFLLAQYTCMFFQASHVCTPCDMLQMPIKWLALESIRNRIYSHKSDVWSFGKQSFIHYISTELLLSFIRLLCIQQTAVDGRFVFGVF